MSVPTHSKGHTLDLILTRSFQDLITDLSVTHYLPSDHAAVICYLKIGKPDCVRMEVKVRKLKDIDIKAFCSDILSSSLYLSPSSDLDELVKQYNDTLRKILDNHAPLLVRKIACRPHTPWYNESLQNVKRHLRQLERKWRKSGLVVDHGIFMSESAKYNYMLKEAKDNYHQKMIENCESRDVIRVVNNMCKSSTRILPRNQSNQQISLADRFSESFGNKIQSVLQNIIPSVESEAESPPAQAEVSKFDKFSHVSPGTVAKLIKDSRSTTCPSDPIPSFLLKRCVDEIPPVIARIINLSFDLVAFQSS